MNETNRRPCQYNFFINDHNYRQLVSAFITDNQALIDHFYTNLTESQAKSKFLDKTLNIANDLNNLKKYCLNNEVEGIYEYIKTRERKS